MSIKQYAYKDALDEGCQQVQSQGYPYVSRVKLDPYEVLRPHAHNSANTHLIMEGELTMWHSKGGRKMGTYQIRQSIDIKPGVCYRAEAGAGGCIFVEGHKDLSPTSAERFELFKSMVQTPTGPMESNGMDEIECKKGECHWSYDKWYHGCQEYREDGIGKRTCDVKAQMQSGRTPR